MSRIRFGVFLPFYTFHCVEKESFSYFEQLQSIVQECERLGYHSIWLDDHLMFGKHQILESWTTLSALSSITNKIRLGIMVLCNSFRNPALLAKMASTLDVLSKGRLEIGVGAGIQRDEHVAYGMTFPKPSVRIMRMKEAVQIMKMMWTLDQTRYNGKYYQLKNAVCEPKPLQKPYPPITIGGTGEQLTLHVTAQHADRFDWGYVPPKVYERKLTVLEKHCAEVSRDFKQIEKSCWPGSQVLIAQDRHMLDEKLSMLKSVGKNLGLEDNSLVCTPDICWQRIRQFVNLGATHFMLAFADLPSLDGLRVFAKKVAGIN